MFKSKPTPIKDFERERLNNSVAANVDNSDFNQLLFDHSPDYGTRKSPSPEPSRYQNSNFREKSKTGNHFYNRSTIEIVNARNVSLKKPLTTLTTTNTIPTVNRKSSQHFRNTVTVFQRNDRS